MFLQILRLASDNFTLLVDLRGGFSRRNDAPQLGEGVHIEGKVVQFTFVIGYRRVDIVVELDELVDIIPHSFVVGMEDMGAVLVHVDAVKLFTVDIAADMAAALQNEAAFASLYTITALFFQYAQKKK